MNHRTVTSVEDLFSFCVLALNRFNVCYEKTRLFICYNFKHGAVATCILIFFIYFLLIFLGLLKHTLRKFSRSSIWRWMFIAITYENWSMSRRPMFSKIHCQSSHSASEITPKLIPLSKISKSRIFQLKYYIFISSAHSVTLLDPPMIYGRILHQYEKPRIASEFSFSLFFSPQRMSWFLSLLIQKT